MINEIAERDIGFEPTTFSLGSSALARTSTQVSETTRLPGLAKASKSPFDWQNLARSLRGLALFCVVLSGCGLHYDPALVVDAPEGADVAVATVLSAYGHSEVKPVIHWYGPKAIQSVSTCTGSSLMAGFRFGIYQSIDFGTPMGGEEHNCEMIVPVPLEGEGFASTALAHEIAHCVFSDNDNHPVPVFGVDGDSVCAKGYDDRGAMALLGKAILALQASEVR